MNAFCVQHNIIWEDKRATHARVRDLLRSADIPAGSLVVLPEMFSTGFSMNVLPSPRVNPANPSGFYPNWRRRDPALWSEES